MCTPVEVWEGVEFIDREGRRCDGGELPDE